MPHSHTQLLKWLNLHSQGCSDHTLHLQNENFRFHPGDGTKALTQKASLQPYQKPVFPEVVCWGKKTCKICIQWVVHLVMGPSGCPKSKHVSDCSVGAITWIWSGLSLWLQWVSHQRTGGWEQPPSRDVPLFQTQGSTKCFEKIGLSQP